MAWTSVRGLTEANMGRTRSVRRDQPLVPQSLSLSGGRVYRRHHGKCPLARRPWIRGEPDPLLGCNTGTPINRASVEHRWLCIRSSNEAVISSDRVDYAEVPPVVRVVQLLAPSDELVGSQPSAMSAKAELIA